MFGLDVFCFLNLKIPLTGPLNRDEHILPVCTTQKINHLSSYIAKWLN